VGNTSGVPGHIHYWFIESENDPANDPVVYWTNGGPGGSGITTGLLTEMGQFQLDADSITNKSSIPNLIYNPYSWSKVANTVFVSQPKGVGFSYCDDVSKASDCANNDVTAAEDAYDFFKAFFEAYPSFADNDFYLTAESYGGIYIPMFMDQMQTRGGFPNLRGAAIGDGCWGTAVGLCAFTSGKSAQIQAEFFAGHGMYDQPLFKRLQKVCGNFSDHDVTLKDCSSALDEMNSKVGKFDVYNIYDTCGRDTSLSTLRRAMASDTVIVDSDVAGANPQLDQVIAEMHEQESTALVNVGGAVNDYVCGRDRASALWLSQPSVQEALHVKSGTVGMKYTWGPKNISGDLRPLYKELVQKYRMLIYSGDTDACVPYWGTEEWTRELGFDVKKDWHSWYSPIESGGTPQRAGYVVDYDTGKTNFKFATVTGAGHMVPTYKPAFALSMISRFLKNEEL
jgi:carboxypeptidase C (cathepsin A)